MVAGYNNRIAHVDLTTRRVEFEDPGVEFYRMYLGGSALGAYYLVRDMPAGADPLGPDNVLVFAASVVTGAPLAGLSRFNVTAKSPLTGAIGDTQCGGHWAPQFKFSGFDAVVVHGRADSPVYLWIADGQVEVHDATHLTPLEPKDVESALRSELNDRRVQIVQNGPAGRRLVRFANVGNALHHFGGRTGMGAVMGSKNLVALAVRGKRRYAFADEDRVRAIARRSAEAYKNHPYLPLFQATGTSGAVDYHSALGCLPTRNMREGVFSQADTLSSSVLKETILLRTATCANCMVHCKRIVAAEEPWHIDEAYGGPEYETIAMLGSNLGIGDIRAVAKANELCNRYGLDTISTGAMIAFAMECFENGVLSRRDTDGLDLRFGNADAVIRMVHAIARREGLGDVLAEGFAAAIAAFGSEAAPYAMHVKGLALPAHMPQVKKTQALMYAVNSFGADHMSCGYDDALETCSDLCVGLGIEAGRPTGVLDEQKVRYVIYTQFFQSVLDSLELCSFLFGPTGWGLYSYGDLQEIVEAVAGLPGNLWFLMKAGERRVNLLRAFNCREGLKADSDVLPERLFEPLPTGPSTGARVPRKELKRAVSTYYQMMGWEQRSGCPSRGKLMELGLSWVNERLHSGRKIGPHSRAAGCSPCMPTEDRRAL